MYLTPADYAIQIRSEIKNLLKGQSPRKLDTAETAAVKQTRSYLKNRYDVDRIFYPVHQYRENMAYKAGQLVWYKEDNQTDDDILVYTCTQNAPAGTSPADTDYFELNDPRDAYINTVIADLTIYLLHSKDSQRMIPELRVDRYDDAIEWLREVGAGRLDADLPQRELEDPEATPFIRYGSYPRENHRF